MNRGCAQRHSALCMRVLASAPARTVAGEEEVCRVRVGEREREKERERAGEREGGRRPRRERERGMEREREREAATMSASSCQPGRASTVWKYLGEDGET